MLFWTKGLTSLLQLPFKVLEPSKADPPGEGISLQDKTLCRNCVFKPGYRAPRTSTEQMVGK